MWKHKTRPTIFCLCIDDFGIKYFKDEDLHHLKETVEQGYTVKIDHTGKNFLGFTLKWNYLEGYVDISMSNYVNHTLQRLQHTPKVFPKYSPHEYIQTRWTRKNDCQYSQQPDSSPLLSEKQTKYIQQVVGTFLYYARALDSTMLPALNDIGSQQAAPTQKVMNKLQQLMDYANTHKNVFVHFYASDMQLAVDSNAAFLFFQKQKAVLLDISAFSTSLLLVFFIMTMDPL